MSDEVPSRTSKAFAIGMVLIAVLAWILWLFGPRVHSNLLLAPILLSIAAGVMVYRNRGVFQQPKPNGMQR